MARLDLRTRTTLVPLAAFLALALAPIRAGAQVSPVGSELQVNSYTTSDQHRPAVASDPTGNFVIVWNSIGSSGTDTSGYSVQGQRYDTLGNPLGGEFQVNTYTTSHQGSSAVSSDAAGNLVVVWESYGSSGTDTSSSSIQAQRYDDTGNPLGGQFLVNSYTTSSQGIPAVASDATGDFVVVWQSTGSSGTDNTLSSIQAQRYDDTGIPQGGQFQVNSYTTSAQYRPAIASDAAGNFVVVWVSNGSSGTDTSNSSVQAQRYDATGATLGGEFQVNSYTTSEQRYPVVASDASGNFVVAWDSYGSSGSDSSHRSIQAQRYDTSGNPQGGQFQVNTYTTSAQVDPAVASDAAGNFVVAWQSLGSTGSDSSYWSVQGRRFAAGGAPLGGDFQVNTYTTSYQRISSVASDAAGNFVVAWESVGSSGSDPSGLSVQAQRYDGLFRDGFETGDTGRWSAAVP